MGVSHKVYFTGYIKDEELLKIYKCADVAVFPSLYEPFGIVALEDGCKCTSCCFRYRGLKRQSGTWSGWNEIIYRQCKFPCRQYTEILHNPEKAEKMKENALKKFTVFTTGRLSQTKQLRYIKVL